MLYALLKICVSICFNLLNLILGGRLSPFGTAAVIVEEADRYLMIELPRRRIAFPGGFMNWRELPAEAAIREGREETGLEVQAGDLIGCYARASNSWLSMSTISFVFQASVIKGELRKNIEGKPLWLAEEELRRRLDRHTVSILDDYLSYRAIKREKGIAGSVPPVWKISAK